jgi:signal transduction histidine kinase
MQPTASVLAAFGEFLIANRDEITRQWVVAVDRSSDITSSEDLTYHQLVDHLPQLCTELAEILKAPDVESNWAAAARDSLRHGRKRWQQGYRLEELIREICLIRRHFIDHWLSAFRDQTAALEGEVKEAAKRIVHRFFDDVIVESTIEFVEEQQQHIKEAEARAAAMDAAKTHFLALISHELRTPLTPVLFAIAALRADPKVPASVGETLEMIRNNVEIEAALVDDLLDASNIADGSFALARSDVDLHACLRTAVASSATDYGLKDVKIELHFNATRASRTGDAARLHRAFWSLLRNAVHVSPAGGTVFVATRNTEAGDLEISIRDLGPIMKTETQERIFMPFEEGRQSPFGVGDLGVSRHVCKSVIEAHEGTVHVTSTEAGGATYIITLPLEDRR